MYRNSIFVVAFNVFFSETDGSSTQKKINLSKMKMKKINNDRYIKQRIIDCSNTLGTFKKIGYVGHKANQI